MATTANNEQHQEQRTNERNKQMQSDMNLGLIACQGLRASWSSETPELSCSGFPFSLKQNTYLDIDSLVYQFPCKKARNSMAIVCIYIWKLNELCLIVWWLFGECFFFG